MPKHLGKELQQRLPHVDLMIGPDSYRRLPELVAAAAERPTIDLRLDDEDYADLDPVSAHGVHAFVPIMRGCDRFCSFCVVPLTRGREKSLPLGEVVRQVTLAVSRGARAVTLLGQTVNSYHHDGRRFSDLLDAVSRVPGLLRVRFTSPHPALFTEETFALKAHTRAAFLDLVASIRRHLPEAGLSTDVIVGYPGEEEEDFAATLSLFEEVEFDSAFLFRYSPRSGTYAYRNLRELEVPPEIAADRLTRLIALQESLSSRRFGRWVGRDVEVLVEGPSRRNPAHGVGKSRDGKTVIVPAAEAGALVTLRIARATTHTLLAEGVGDESPAAEVVASIEV
jgi:tRNA-2-methylthio-N6-dimethylallyladenosine synthase